MISSSLNPGGDPFTFLIMLEVEAGSVIGLEGLAVDGRWPAAPQLTSSHPSKGDASAVAELRMRMVAAIRGGPPPAAPRGSLALRGGEGGGGSPAPRLRRRRSRGRREGRTWSARWDPNLVQSNLHCTLTLSIF